MEEQALRGVLGFKGECGDSAYIVAVKNGFVGSEKDWLATLGTSSHFERESYIYSTEIDRSLINSVGIPLPAKYTSNSFIEIRINGISLNSNEYGINLLDGTIPLKGIFVEEGSIVELVLFTMSTNELPIVESINESSTNETAPGTKAVYDYFKQFINTIYPVGSIYMSVNETSPETLFGGTWERIKDRFLLGAGDTYAAGSTGGEESHKLELYEIPNHRHCILNYNSNGASLDTSPVLLGESRTGWEGAAFTSFEGGGLPHNNMPPYLTVNIWKRVS